MTDKKSAAMISEEMAKRVLTELEADEVRVELVSPKGKNTIRTDTTHNALMTAVMLLHALPAVYKSLCREGIDGHAVDPEKLKDALTALTVYMLNARADTPSAACGDSVEGGAESPTSPREIVSPLSPLRGQLPQRGRTIEPGVAPGRECEHGADTPEGGAQREDGGQ